MSPSSLLVVDCAAHCGAQSDAELGMVLKVKDNSNLLRIKIKSKSKITSKVLETKMHQVLVQDETIDASQPAKKQ